MSAPAHALRRFASVLSGTRIEMVRTNDLQRHVSTFVFRPFPRGPVQIDITNEILMGLSIQSRATEILVAFSQAGDRIVENVAEDIVVRPRLLALARQALREMERDDGPRAVRRFLEKEVERWSSPGR